MQNNNTNITKNTKDNHNDNSNDNNDIDHYSIRSSSCIRDL